MPRTMSHLEAIRTHIEASNPCTLKSVMQWAAYQGYGGSRAIEAIGTLTQQGIISVELEDYTDHSELVIDLL